MKPKLGLAELVNIFNMSRQAIHLKIKTQKIPSYKHGTQIYIKHEGARQLLGHKINPKIFAFELVKGGVGKTSLCFHCAVKASLHGLKCALIDLDQQANLTRAFRIDASKSPIMIDVIKDKLNLKDSLIKTDLGIDILPSRFENAILDTYLLINALPLDRVFKQILEPLKKDYDLVFIDCPPSLGAAVTAAVIASDYTIAPVEPDEFSMSGLALTIKEVEDISQKYGKDVSVKIVLNKFSTKTNLSHKTLAALLSSSKTKKLLCQSFIRNSQEFPNSFDKGLSIYENLKPTPAKEDIDLLTKELIEMCAT